MKQSDFWTSLRITFEGSKNSKRKEHNFIDEKNPIKFRFETNWIEIESSKRFSPETSLSPFSNNLSSKNNSQRRIPSGLVVMTLTYRVEGRWFESAAWLLSQKGFETMNPALPAKAVGPQPANVPLRNEV